MSKKNTLLTFKGICMNFLLELRFFILSHPVTSKQPHKIVQIHMVHPVTVEYDLSGCTDRELFIQYSKTDPKLEETNTIQSNWQSMRYPIAEHSMCFS